MPEGHLVSAFPLCQPCCTPQGQAESGGQVLVTYAGSVHPAAALRDSVLCLPTDIHSLFVNKPSWSSSKLFVFAAAARPVRTLADAVLLLHDASSLLATLLRCEVRGAHARLLHTAGLLT